MSKTIDIQLTNKTDIEGVVMCIVGSDVIDNLLRISDEREKLAKKSEKLNEKKAKKIRYARKIINQFANSRQIDYDQEHQAIGIYEGETIYVGDKERLKDDPTQKPMDTDIIKGKLTKSEKRLYQGAVESYRFLNEQINEYIRDLSENELQLMAFEKNILQDQEFNKEEKYLTVSLVDGKVYLCDYDSKQSMNDEHS